MPRQPRHNPFAPGQTEEDPNAQLKDALQQAIPGGDQPAAEPPSNDEIEKKLLPSPTSEPKAELPAYLAHFQMIPINLLRPGRYQTRMEEGIDEATYAQLEAQMRDSYERGRLRLFVPVMPDPASSGYYNPAQGMHRRIEIAARLGITELPCYVDEYDRESLALGTVYENMGRQDLTIVELGYLFLQVRADFNLTQEECAIKLKIRSGRDFVKRCEAAAKAAPDIQHMVFLAPERSASVIAPLSQLDVMFDDPAEAAEKRAPIIEAFLEEKIKAEGVVLAVNEILNGGSFSLDENSKSAATPKIIERMTKAARAHKSWSSYFAQLGSNPLSLTERTELEQLRAELDAVLNATQVK